MEKQSSRMTWCWLSVVIGLGMSGAIAVRPHTAKAQLVADPSLGTTVEPLNARIDLIKNGTRPANGANLFHSFREFNVGQNRGVYFLVPDANVVNILARVTGSNPSQILGVLGTLQQLADGTLLATNANLFLMNPNGIIFGQGAQLDVDRSFVATTANAIQFPGGVEFSRTSSVDPQNPLLTVNPSAFLFNQATVQPIQNQSQVGLRVASDRSLLLLGGDVTLDQGNISTIGGHIELGGLTAPGIVGLNNSSNVLSLKFPEGVARANVLLTHQAGITAVNRGSITIYTDNVKLSSSSSILSLVGTSGSQAGDIKIDATGAVKLSDSSIIGSGLLQGVSGSLGKITISGRTIDLINGSVIESLSSGQGNAGNVTLKATETISLYGRDQDGYTSGIKSQVGSLESFTGTGNGGTITLQARSLALKDGAGVLTNNLFAQGNAGNIQVDVSDSFSMTDGAQLRSSISGTGNAGNLIIHAGSLSLTDGANLNASTYGQGNAGNVKLMVSGIASVDGVTPDGRSSGVFSAVAQGAMGKGGNVELSAGTLSVTNGANLNASTYGQGDAGNVTLMVSGTASFDGVTPNRRFGSGVFSAVAQGATGKGGDVELSAGTLSVTNGAVLSASSAGQGDAGKIVLRVHDQLRVENGTIVTASQFTSGGSIDIAAQSIRMLGNSNIQTNVFNGVGNGGSITLTADSIIALNDSNILAFAQQGNGGNITFNTPAFFGQNYRPGSPPPFDGNNRVDINASGTVSGIITLPDVSFLQNGLTEFPQTFTDTTQLLANSCIVRRTKQNGRFVITGSGGLPLRPSDAPLSPFPTGEVGVSEVRGEGRGERGEEGQGEQGRQGKQGKQEEERGETYVIQNSTLGTQNSPDRPWKIGDPIVEPQGVYKLANGDLVMSRECSNP